jgi:hypothetical protein
MDSPTINSTSILLMRSASSESNYDQKLHPMKKAGDKTEINRWNCINDPFAGNPKVEDLRLRLKAEMMLQLKELQKELSDTDWMFDKKL